MANFVGRLFLVLSILLVGTPLQALDFDKEIHRQEKAVKVRYQRPPHSLAYFLKSYEICKSQFDRSRTQCNIREAKRRYQEYSYAWQQQQKQKYANVASGEMNVLLEPKMNGSF